MTFTESIRTCFRKYADFNGRAARSEFWWWMLFNVLAAFVLSMFSERLAQLLSLVLLLPNIAVSARRLHDIDRSGWWQLIGFVPLIGWIVLLFWYVQDSKPTTRFA